MRYFHRSFFKIGAKLQKLFELSAQFEPKNTKKSTILSRLGDL
jgi:hypothetical protein